MENILKYQCIDASTGLYIWKKRHFRILPRVSIEPPVDGLLIVTPLIENENETVSFDSNPQSFPLVEILCAKIWNKTLNYSGFDILWMNGTVWSIETDEIEQSIEWVETINLYSGLTELIKSNMKDEEKRILLGKLEKKINEIYQSSLINEFERVKAGRIKKKNDVNIDENIKSFSTSEYNKENITTTNNNILHNTLSSTKSTTTYQSPNIKSTQLDSPQSKSPFHSIISLYSTKKQECLASSKQKKNTSVKKIGGEISDRVLSTTSINSNSKSTNTIKNKNEEHFISNKPSTIGTSPLPSPCPNLKPASLSSNNNMFHSPTNRNENYLSEAPTIVKTWEPQTNSNPSNSSNNNGEIFNTPNQLYSAINHNESNSNQNFSIIQSKDDGSNSEISSIKQNQDKIINNSLSVTSICYNSEGSSLPPGEVLSVGQSLYSNCPPKSEISSLKYNQNNFKNKEEFSLCQLASITPSKQDTNNNLDKISSNDSPQSTVSSVTHDSPNDLEEKIKKNNKITDNNSDLYVDRLINNNDANITSNSKESDDIINKLILKINQLEKENNKYKESFQRSSIISENEKDKYLNIINDLKLEIKELKNNNNNIKEEETNNHLLYNDLLSINENDFNINDKLKNYLKNLQNEIITLKNENFELKNNLRENIMKIKILTEENNNLKLLNNIGSNSYQSYNNNNETNLLSTLNFFKLSEKEKEIEKDNLTKLHKLEIELAEKNCEIKLLNQTIDKFNLIFNQISNPNIKNNNLFTSSLAQSGLNSSINLNDFYPNFTLPTPNSKSVNFASNSSEISSNNFSTATNYNPSSHMSSQLNSSTNSAINTKFPSSNNSYVSDFQYSIGNYNNQYPLIDTNLSSSNSIPSSSKIPSTFSISSNSPILQDNKENINNLSLIQSNLNGKNIDNNYHRTNQYKSSTETIINSNNQTEIDEFLAMSSNKINTIHNENNLLKDKLKRAEILIYGIPQYENAHKNLTKYEENTGSTIKLDVKAKVVGKEIKKHDKNLCKKLKNNSKNVKIKV